MDRELVLLVPPLEPLPLPPLEPLVEPLGLLVVVVLDGLPPLDAGADLVRLLDPDGFFPFVVEGLAVDDVVEEPEGGAPWAWVIWMFRWPSFESALPSLATKLKASTSTPAGAW